MTMVCDRCGETFEYPEFSISERTQRVENNSICRCMDNELYCPMKMTSNPLGRCVCEKEKCAWWRQLDNCCSVWQIAWKLDNIETKMKR